MNYVQLKLWTLNKCTVNGMGLQTCDVSWKRRVNPCRLEWMRSRSCGARLIGLQGRAINYGGQEIKMVLCGRAIGKTTAR